MYLVVMSIWSLATFPMFVEPPPCNKLNKLMRESIHDVTKHQIQVLISRKPFVQVSKKITISPCCLYLLCIKSILDMNWGTKLATVGAFYLSQNSNLTSCHKLDNVQNKTGIWFKIDRILKLHF